jgi:predicted nuclease of restriction endonuclease-like (RecB) superfamily
VNALRSELSWTHYRLLLKVEREEAVKFFLEEAIEGRWSTRTLERQINSLYYERMIMTRTEGRPLVKAEAESKKEEMQASDLIKDPLCTGIPEPEIQYRFLRKRIADLVFYNYILKRFLVIDLKTGELTHQDIGQMDMYVRYFEDQVRRADDNPTIGLILCTKKNKTVVKYSLLNDSKQIFASKDLSSNRKAAKRRDSQRIGGDRNGKAVKKIKAPAYALCRKNPTPPDEERIGVLPVFLQQTSRPPFCPFYRHAFCGRPHLQHIAPDKLIGKSSRKALC